jgi:hypothetical protein
MRRLLGRGLVPLVLMTAVVLISGCGADVAPGDTSATPAATLAPLTQHLVFKGDISGILITGVDVRPLTHDNPAGVPTEQADGTFFVPPPSLTQCATIDTLNSGTLNDYLADIVGTVGTQRYAIEIEVSMDDPAYTKPGTKALLPDNFTGSVQVYEVGGQNREWVDTFSPTLQNSVVVLHADRKSGTVDAWMDSAALPQNGGAPATLHVQGDWRCG